MEVLDFVREMKERATQGLLEVAGGGERIERSYKFEVGSATIVIIKGGAIEKAAISHLTLRGVRTPASDKKSDGMVYQMEVFPANPYCPMGHFNTQWTMGDSPAYFMNLDLFPAVRVEEDLTGMRRVMDGVAEQFGQDKEKMREGLDDHYTMEHFSYPLAAKVGCKLLNLQEGEVPLFASAYRSFFDAYLKILKTRKDSKYSEEERRLKLERNGKWLEYYAIKDSAVKMAQAYSVSPEVLIDLGYPPSAVF
jgi:coproporphyrinogen III oxidase